MQTDKALGSTLGTLFEHQHAHSVTRLLKAVSKLAHQCGLPDTTASADRNETLTHTAEHLV